MNEKRINARFTPKGDIEANWKKATGFVPLDKEIIIYKPDENYSYSRMKIGDGITGINELPFFSTPQEKLPIAYINNEGELVFELGSGIKDVFFNENDELIIAPDEQVENAYINDKGELTLAIQTADGLKTIILGNVKGRTPHFRLNEKVLEIKYDDESSWTALVDFSTIASTFNLRLNEETFYLEAQRELNGEWEQIANLSDLKLAHSHKNKAVLDKITNSIYKQIENTIAKAHSHNNLNLLNMIDQEIVENVAEIPLIRREVDELSKDIDALNSAISNKANKTELSAIAFSGSYNDLTNAPIIPSIEGLATEDFVIAKISEIDITNHLNNYAKIEYVDERVAALVNSAPETLDTLGELAIAFQNNQEVIDALNSAISNKANKTELSAIAFSGNYNDLTNTPTIPSIEGLATEDFVTDKISKFKISDYSITTEKIATNAVTSAKIADGAVGTSEIADEAISTIKVKNSAITNEKIAHKTITAAEIADKAINSGHLAEYLHGASIGKEGVDEEGNTIYTAEIFNDYGYNKATGEYSHAEGLSVKAIGRCSHAENYGTEANGKYSHAQNFVTKANGEASHAENYYTKANGKYSHAEGRSTEANGEASHAEGEYSKANGIYSHAEGLNTIASGEYQHVQGKNNIEDLQNKFAHIVGNGSQSYLTSRSNAHTIDWQGNGWFAGDVYVGSLDTDGNYKTKLATEDFVNERISILIDSAPETLDTLGELATAIKNNETVVETLNSAIGNKANKSDLASVATSGNYNELNNKPTIPTALSDLADDANHRIVTDTEKNTWNNNSGFKGTIQLKDGAIGQVTSSQSSNSILIPINEIKESYVTWGGKVINGNLSVFDSACLSNINNCFAGNIVGNVKIEISRDNGDTWTEKIISSESLAQLLDPKVTNSGSGIVPLDKPYTINDKIRITMTDFSHTCKLYKMLFNMYILGFKANIHIQITHTNNYKHEYTYPINMNWNSFPVTPYAVKISTLCCTINITEILEHNNPGFHIYNICGLGEITTMTSGPNLAKTGDLYSYDYQGNAIFPAKITSTEFIEGDIALDKKYATKEEIKGKMDNIEITPEDEGKFLMIQGGAVAKVAIPNIAEEVF